MFEPGAECPSCNARLSSSSAKCRNCGWVPEGGEGKAPPKRCAVCNEGFQFWTSLMAGDDGQRRCATCHVARLARFASKPTDRCSVSGCGLTVAQHIAEGKRAMAEYARQCLVQTERTPRGGVEL